MSDLPTIPAVTDEEPNEILALARDAKEQALAAAEATAARAKSWPLAKIGLGVSIGSAAVAAAVMFVNRDRSAK